MDCPHCKECFVFKDYENNLITVCRDCGGIWLQPTQLSTITAIRDEQFSVEEIQDALKAAYVGNSTTQKSPTLACPVCSEPLNTINYNYSSGVMLDCCPQGHGLFFDKNELEKVQIHMEHWEDEKNLHKAELLKKLKEVRNDTFAAEQELNDSGAKGRKISLATILDRIFDYFGS